MVYNLEEQDILNTIGNYVLEKYDLKKDTGKSYVSLNWIMNNNKINGCNVILLEIEKENDPIFELLKNKIEERQYLKCNLKKIKLLKNNSNHLI